MVEFGCQRVTAHLLIWTFCESLISTFGAEELRVSLPRSVSLAAGITGVEAGGCSLSPGLRATSNTGTGSAQRKDSRESSAGQGAHVGGTIPWSCLESLLAYGSIVHFLLDEGAELLQAPA